MSLTGNCLHCHISLVLLLEMTLRTDRLSKKRLLSCEFVSRKKKRQMVEDAAPVEGGGFA